MDRMEIIKIALDKKMIFRKDWIKYLIIPSHHNQLFDSGIEILKDAQFSKVLENHVSAYISGETPPAEIAPVIMNLADDHLSGREVTLRAGDYVTLQSHFRKTALSASK